MKPSALPRTTRLLSSRGERLRQALVDIISEVEVGAAKRGGTTQAANVLHTLLSAGVTAVAALRDLVAPTVSTRTQAFGVASIVLTFSKNLDPDYVPAASAFAISSPVRTVTSVAVSGRQVRIGYSGVVLTTADTPDIAYTQPGTNQLRDEGGVLAASFTAAAVTVAAS